MVLFSPILGLLFLTLVALIFSRKKWKDVMGTFRWENFFFFTALIFLQLFLTSFLLENLSTRFEWNDTQVVDAAVEKIEGKGWLGAAELGVSALAEELFFRGVLYTLISPLVSVVVFGLAHVGYGSSVEFAGAILAGIILVRARKTTGSIYPGLLAHFLYNAVIVFVR